MADIHRVNHIRTLQEVPNGGRAHHAADDSVTVPGETRGRVL